MTSSRRISTSRLPSDNLSDGESFFLCDSQGTIIYKETELDLPGSELQGYLNRLITAIQDGQFDSYLAHVVDAEGGQRAVYYSRMDNGWYSIITVPLPQYLRRSPRPQP